MSDSKTTDGIEIHCLHCQSATTYPLKAPVNQCSGCSAEIKRSEAIEEYLKTLMSETFQVAREKIEGNSLLREIGDSLGTIEMLMKLESEFGISIGHEDIEELETVNEVAKYIDSRVLAAS